jgi:hypothetical protein
LFVFFFADLHLAQPSVSSASASVFAFASAGGDQPTTGGAGIPSIDSSSSSSSSAVVETIGNSSIFSNAPEMMTTDMETERKEDYRSEDFEIIGEDAHTHAPAIRRPTTREGPVGNCAGIDLSLDDSDDDKDENDGLAVFGDKLSDILSQVRKLVIVPGWLTLVNIIGSINYVGSDVTIIIVMLSRFLRAYVCMCVFVYSVIYCIWMDVRVSLCTKIQILCIIHQFIRFEI